MPHRYTSIFRAMKSTSGRTEKIKDFFGLHHNIGNPFTNDISDEKSISI